MHRQGDCVPPGVWDSASRAALPTKTPSLSLDRGMPLRNRSQALLQRRGHLEAMLASPPFFFVFVAGLTPPVLLFLAAFLRLPIRGCLRKGRATHYPRYVVIPGLFLPCGTEVAPRLAGAGARKMPLLATSPGEPAAVWPSAVRRYVAKAKAVKASVHLLFPALK